MLAAWRRFPTSRSEPSGGGDGTRGRRRGAGGGELTGGNSCRGRCKTGGACLTPHVKQPAGQQTSTRNPVGSELGAESDHSKLRGGDVATESCAKMFYRYVPADKLASRGANKKCPNLAADFEYKHEPQPRRARKSFLHDVLEELKGGCVWGGNFFWERFHYQKSFPQVSWLAYRLRQSYFR